MTDTDTKPDAKPEADQTEPDQRREVVIRDDDAPSGGKLSKRDIRIGAGGVTFENAAEVSAYAHQMASATLARDGFRGEPGNCVMLIEDSIRFGIPPMTLMRVAYIVKQKNGGYSLGYESRFFAAVIIRRALARRPKYSFDGDGLKMVCTCEVVAKDDGEIIVHKSPPLGQINPRNSPLWVSDPQQQLAYYTIRALARMHFPDTLMGLFAADEIGIDRPQMNVTPERTSSGLAERLSGSNGQQGLQIEHVETALADAGSALEREPVRVERKAPANRPVRQSRAKKR